MTNPENQDPEKSSRPNDRRGLPTGVYIWLLVMIVSGIGLWLLSDLFPGQLSSRSNQIDVVRSVSILALISSGLIFSRRFHFSDFFRNIAIWIGITAIVVLGYSYQDELAAIADRLASEFIPSRPQVVGQGQLSLTRSDNGHFNVVGYANGTRVHFMIDTGASDITLSASDAQRIGIDLATLAYTVPYQTANGRTFGARYRLEEFSIGPIEFHDVLVSINRADMDVSLLGMSFLNRLASYEVKGRKLIMRQ